MPVFKRQAHAGIARCLALLLAQNGAFVWQVRSCDEAAATGRGSYRVEAHHLLGSGA
ncbi:hypothetical protein XCV3426 [Xanthomonas euvesicatoria pv. vesicatoria str. 85-10]|uniref:Uncharacterized protein n=1 Tax=Xanthomonas euvesicatoria pv. vesicatoria (strain 85-10) TaxID=316273 RepID=Q3BQ06_XANE5|nr:hypothetical protein XCV3426 [Xanthomonas euvesicatoria pv. vesicatoria str. 85-10]